MAAQGAEIIFLSNWAVIQHVVMVKNETGLYFLSGAVA